MRTREYNRHERLVPNCLTFPFSRIIPTTGLFSQNEHPEDIRSSRYFRRRIAPQSSDSDFFPEQWYDTLIPSRISQGQTAMDESCKRGLTRDDESRKENQRFRIILRKSDLDLMPSSNDFHLRGSEEPREEFNWGRRFKQIG